MCKNSDFYHSTRSAPLLSLKQDIKVYNLIVERGINDAENQSERGRWYAENMIIKSYSIPKKFKTVRKKLF